MRPQLIILLVLALCGCDDAREPAKPAEAPGKQSQRGSASAPAGAAKVRDRDGKENDADSGVLRKMEKALEDSDPEAALLGFRELIAAREKISEEALQAWRAKASGDAELASRLPELERRMQLLDIGVAEAGVALRNHGVEQSAINTAVKEYQQEKARNMAIRELEEAGANP